MMSTKTTETTAFRDDIISHLNGAPSLEEGDMYSLLPITAFDVILSNEEASIEKIESFFVDFLEGVLEEISVTYRFDYSHLESNGIISTFNQPQPLGTEYHIKMDGIVYYFDEAPTKESLAQSLNVYFSFWGASDLQEYLKSVGLKTAVVVSIFIGGEKISFVSNNVLEEKGPGVQNGDNSIRNFFFKDGGDISKPNVVMLYTGVVLIVVAVTLLVFRHRIGRRRVNRDRESQSRESHSSKKYDDHGDEELGVSSKVPKTLRRKKTGMSTSISSQGANVSKMLPMSTPKKASKDLENSAGKSGSFPGEKPAKFQSYEISEKKLGDSKTDNEKHSTGDNTKGESKKELGDSKTGKEKHSPRDKIPEKSEKLLGGSKTVKEKHSPKDKIPEESEKKIDDSKNGKEKGIQRDKAIAESEKQIVESKTGKEKCNPRDKASDNLSLNLLEKVSQNPKTIMDECEPSTTASPLNLEKKKSGDVKNDMKTCEFTNKNSSETHKLDPPCKTHQQLSNQTNDIVLNLQLNEF